MRRHQSIILVYLLCCSAIVLADNITNFYTGQPIWTGMAVTTVAAAGTPNVTAGLVAWWTFNEGVGTNAADSSGNSYNAHYYNPSATNLPTWTNGIISFAYMATNGDESALANPGSGSLLNFATTNIVTVTAWVRLQGSDPGHSEVALSIGTAGSSNRRTFVAHRNAQQLSYWNANSSWLTTFAPLTRNTWYHVVWIDRPGSGCSFYTNGVLVSTLATGALSPTVDGNAMIGASDSGDPSHGSILGVLDDVRIYNRELTTNEIMTIYQWR